MPRRMTKSEWRETQYNSTTVGVFQSQGAIMGLLKEHWGVRKVGFIEFISGGGGVLFEYEGRPYRFDAIPLEVEDATDAEKERVERQAWRWLFYHVKDLIGSSLFMPVEDLLLPHMLVAPGEKGEEALTLGEAIRRGKTKFELPPGREE